MANLYGEVETDRNSKHQIGSRWITSTLFYGSTKESKLACKVEIVLDKDGKPILTITLGNGIQCNLVKNEG